MYMYIIVCPFASWPACFDLSHVAITAGYMWIYRSSRFTNAVRLNAKAAIRVMKTTAHKKYVVHATAI